MGLLSLYIISKLGWEAFVLPTEDVETLVFTSPPLCLLQHLLSYIKLSLSFGHFLDSFGNLHHRGCHSDFVTASPAKFLLKPFSTTSLLVPLRLTSKIGDSALRVLVRTSSLFFLRECCLLFLSVLRASLITLITFFITARYSSSEVILISSSRALMQSRTFLAVS